MSANNCFTIESLLNLPRTTPTTIDLTAVNNSGHLRKRSYDTFSTGESIESDKDSASGDEGMYCYRVL